MKVVHVGTIDEGGAYYAMERIAKAMNMQGIDSDILLREKSNDYRKGYAINTGWKRYISKTKNFVNLLLSSNCVQVDFCGTNISSTKLIKEADVIILHWVNSFVSYGTLERLKGLDKPVIMVLHDMWLLTGGCHYDNYCGLYVEKCINCPIPSSTIKKRIIRYAYRRKEKAVKNLQPVLVMPSNWMKECASVSPVTKQLRSFVIPNPIDLETFSIRDRKNVLKIENKKVILFSAMRPFTNEKKGFTYLKEAISLIQEDGYVLVICGDKSHAVSKINKVDVVCQGIIKTDEEMAQVYNCADVFVAPSIQDNYPNSILEAMACGVPCVAFNIGGMKDLIIHKENGFLADYENVNQLYDGIMYCIKHSKEMGQKAREERERVNSSDCIGEQYVRLCKEV